ncbi:MAG: hypothetical protein K6T51_00710 [Rubrobacteraceae bacterium]|uniref:hypothetical protein n=1 Tax=Rubrobacter naiadicus TaxID=1392641 RepID=UPI00235E419F|nr:hypothetical protein [Rubrobacter naiadicus]MBX6763210.1 hypothetical protein [Rubrobacteraceae bacterium]MCL6437102.1 hypothetical protein [Rubrobacteraceae bacterium]
MEIGDRLLRVGNIEEESDVETVRDLLDELGLDYEYVRSEPEDSYPRSVYFYVSYESSEHLGHLLDELSERHGYDAEIL